jgi:hypothetical protein
MTDGSIHTQTYQKEMNLYLYRPPTSAQPKSILYGLIYGTLHRYYWQNTDRKWLDHFVGLFYQRLLARGHRASDLTRLFLRASKKVDGSSLPKPRSRTAALEEIQDSIFLHLQYHPQDPDRQELQTLFHDTCRAALDDAHIPHGETAGEPVSIGRMIVAYSRAPNVATLVRRNRLRPEFDTHVSGSD